MGSTINLKGYLMILISALGFGSYGVWSKLIGEDFGVFTHAWVRSGLVLIVLAILIIVTNKYKRVDVKDRNWIIITVLFGVATQAPLYYALNNMSIGTATLIFYASYLIASYVIGKVSFAEKIDSIKVFSLVIAVIGLGLVFGFSLGVFPLLAMLMAAINGIASGGEVAFTKKSTDKYSSLQISIYIWLGIFITHLPVALLTNEPFPALSQTSSWIGMLIFATVGLISFWLVVEGYKYVEASIGSLLGLTEIIFGIILGIVVFKETLTVSTVIGGALVLFAAMLPDLIALSKRKRETNSGLEEIERL